MTDAVAVMDNKIHVIDKDIRCPQCDKLLTRAKFIFHLPVEFTHPEVKMGLETKCPRCKHMCYELNVV